MHELKPTPFTSILKRAAEIRAVYNTLTPEQRKEVDDYTAKIVAAAQSGDLEALRALPVNPMLAHMDAAHSEPDWSEAEDNVVMEGWDDAEER